MIAPRARYQYVGLLLNIYPVDTTNRDFFDEFQSELIAHRKRQAMMANGEGECNSAHSRSHKFGNRGMNLVDRSSV